MSFVWYTNIKSSRILACIGVPWDEENWRAQYGQVVTSVDSDAHALIIRDLWDWHMEEQTIGKKKAARLVGRIVKTAVKLHPSIPSGNTFLRTSCICETHFDLVRVETGLSLLQFLWARLIYLVWVNFITYCNTSYNGLFIIDLLLFG